VYNLAREVWGHDATRQSAYAYTPTKSSFVRKEKRKMCAGSHGKFHITRAVVERLYTYFSNR